MSERKSDSVPVGDRVSIFKRGGTWYCNYQDGRRQIRKSLKTTSRRQAFLSAQRIETRLREGAPARQVQEATVVSAAAAFLEHAVVEGRSAKTLAKYRYVLSLVSAHAAKKLVTNASEIDMGFADSFRAAIAANRAPKTVHTSVTILRSLTLFALRRRMTATDGLAGYRLRKPKPTPQPCWAPEEADRIVDAAPSSYQPYLLFLRETGCRAGEAKYLTWKDIDFDAGVALIRPKPGWKPKSGDQRKVPLTPRVRVLLARLPRRGPWVFTAPVRGQHIDAGRQISERRALVALKKILAGLSLEGHLHTFRHTFVSQCLTRGIPEAVVREWVGHVDPRVIRLYTHVSDAVTQQYLARFVAGSNSESSPLS